MIESAQARDTSYGAQNPAENPAISAGGSKKAVAAHGGEARFVSAGAMTDRV
jgi:hypothetical protein